MRESTDLVRIVTTLHQAPHHTLGMILTLLGGTARLSPRSTPVSRLVDGVIDQGPFSALDFRCGANPPARPHSLVWLAVRTGVLIGLDELHTALGPSLHRAYTDRTPGRPPTVVWRLPGEHPPTDLFVREDSHALAYVYLDRREEAWDRIAPQPAVAKAGGDTSGEPS